MSTARSKAKFQTEWVLNYGVEVSTRCPSTSEVSMFCRQFGREDEDGERKRKRTTNVKYFSYPWRSDNFTTHLKQQHPMKWKEYTLLSVNDKRSFFVTQESAEVVDMRSFVQPGGSMKASIIAKEKFKFTIDADIMDTLIFGLRFNNSEEEEKACSVERAKTIALKHFVRHEDDNVYVIEVKKFIIHKLIQGLLHNEVELMCTTPNSKDITMTFFRQTSNRSLYAPGHSRCTIGRYTNELMSPVWGEYAHRFSHKVILVFSRVTLPHRNCKNMEILHISLKITSHTNV